MSRIQFQPKLVGETLPYVFDFVSRMGVSDIIFGSSVVVTVYSGVDPVPNAMVYGGASNSGTQVTQKLMGGVAGVVYQVMCTMVTSSGLTFQLFGLLAVESGAV
jgi:hypothetical protein